MCVRVCKLCVYSSYLKVVSEWVRGEDVARARCWSRGCLVLAMHFTESLFLTYEKLHNT